MHEHAVQAPSHAPCPSGAGVVALGHGVRAAGALPRHLTSQSAAATDDLAGRPDELAGLTGHVAGRPDELAGLTDHPSHRPGEPDGRPSGLAGRPTSPEGRGAGARSPGAHAPAPAVFVPEGRRGARQRHGWSIARAVFVPEGRWGVATGGARASRAEPVGRRRVNLACPGGAEEWTSATLGHRSAHEDFLRPCRGEIDRDDAFHGLRIAQSRDAQPVATALEEPGVEHHTHARAGGVHAFGGEVPEGRHAPMPLGQQRGHDGAVRRGF